MKPQMQRHLPLLAISGLLLNALVWGTSWWPFRTLQANGLHSLWATVFIYAIACVLIIATQRGVITQLFNNKALWWILLAAGTTNATFNWAVTLGDVVRVVLLFYLMPIWAALLARWLLNEPLTASAGVRIALALAGAALVLSKPETSLLQSFAAPISLADILGIIGGFSFALNNVMLRKHADAPAGARALAMFSGGVLLAGGLAFALTLFGVIASPVQATQSAWLGASVLAVWFIVGNLSLQYGASRLPSSVTAVVMLAEVVFASASAVWWGGETLTQRVVLGGGLIMVSAALAAYHHRGSHE
jgi:drug/metabolite transporter (DMT)-like permease